MAKVKVKSRKPAQFAYKAFTMGYDKVPYEKTYEEVYGWIKATKGVRPDGFKCCIGIYHDNPHEVAPEKCRSEIGWTFKGDAKPTGDIKFKALPAMEVAEMKYVGPSEGYAKAWAELRGWMEQNGYVGAGSPIEVYTKKPKVKDGETIMYTLLQAPVKKK